MRLSRYLKTWPYPEKPGHLLVYSTKKTSLVLLPTEVFAALEQGAPPENLIEPLKKLGMLVQDHEEEKKSVHHYLDEMNRLNTCLTISVILGLDCNFACKYCYEGTMKGKHAMTDAIADQLIAFIKKHFTADKKNLTLNFYGGEPLLYTKRIKHISKELKPFIEAQGAIYEFSLVTNGSLLTGKTVEELVPFGLKRAKITIDGPAENHNHSRPFKSGTGSFDIILENIKECCEAIKIAIGGNFTSENYQSFPTLLDHLETIGLTPDKLAQVKFDPVMQINDEFSLAEFRNGCGSVNEPWLVDASLSLREEILQRGYHTPKITPTACMVELEDSFTVHYDGAIYKCPALIGHEGFDVGDVWSGIKDYSATHHLDHWEKNEECLECEYLPLCFGGCRYMQLQKHGHMAEVECQKAYYDAALESFLRQDIQYRLKTG